MSDIAIRCDHLSKQYRIGERESYKALRDVITDGVASPFRRLRSALARNGGTNSNGSHSALSTQHSALPSETRNSKLETQNSFWALDDVSFEVKRGEVVGIIGRNGAGKSTLLKILSRITKPTTGRAEIHGRVGSLLEVGTGFHPELTGRENIYLNAAILGMRRAEVGKKFDEIVAFAEVEKFIDTPVKRYSSGMYVRLAFAVAAHMETEVLLVDEVLAVGDAQFQKKCLGKMDDAARHGRTVLFVSHNMTAVVSLCRWALLMDGGSISTNGPVKEVTEHYLASTAEKNATREQIWEDMASAPGDDFVRVRKVEIITERGDHQSPIEMDTPFQIGIEYWNHVEKANLIIEIIVRASDGSALFHSFSNEEENLREHLLPRGLFRSVCLVPGNLLNEGKFQIEVYFLHGSTSNYFSLIDAGVITVLDTKPRPARTYYGRFIGNIHPRLRWDTQVLSQ
jgi:homopolymeric O-antigen transport system ATP-binding protein